MLTVLSCVVVITAAFVAAVHLEARWLSDQGPRTPATVETVTTVGPSDPGAAHDRHVVAAPRTSPESARA